MVKNRAIWLQKLRELICAQIGLTQNSSQGASVNLPMVRHHRLSERSVTTHDDVAAVLPSDRKASLLKRTNNI
jgi:hypothetical protein